MAKDKAHWTTSDEQALLDYLLNLDPKAGDGKNFKPVVWNGASALLAPLVTKGALKTASSCKSKWGDVCHHASIVFLSAKLCNR